MMQAIVSEGVRHDQGAPVTLDGFRNILKTIKPLVVLDDLYKKLLDADKPTLKKLKNLLLRIYNISIFDPACGSGNFLCWMLVYVGVI